MPEFSSPDSPFAETRPDVRAVLDLLRGTEASLTPSALTARIVRDWGLDRRAARALIRDLVAANLLAYADRHGRTVVEISRNRPVCLSARVVVAPPECTVPEHPGHVVVRIQGGPAFGDGGHPTTRLSVRAIDRLLEKITASGNPPLRMALDIGTGSGILALTALALGVHRAIALDIDPLARADASANARFNRMENRLTVSGEGVDTLDPPFDLILANLRPPTLRRMLPDLRRLAPPGAGLVLSGFRDEEAEDLFETVESAGIVRIRDAREGGWAAGTFRFADGGTSE